MADQTLAEGGVVSEPPALQQGAEASVNEGVRVRTVPACSLCGKQGRLLYTGLRDRLFEGPGVWGHFKCAHCGLIWLNPQPVPEDIGKLYGYYYTHEPAPLADASLPARASLRDKVLASVLAAHLGYPKVSPTGVWAGIGKIGRHVPLLRDWAGYQVMHLPAALRGRLLDIGCGNGTFLAVMREQGWKVQGVELDPEAAQVARERLGLEVTTGTLEAAALPAASFDAITMKHVIEHVPDPVALLAECCRILRPGGRLVAMTPNAESLGHRRLGVSWLHLDPPRHLHLFSLRTFEACARKAGLRVEALRSISCLSRDTYIFSQAIRRGVPHPLNGYRPDRWAAFQSWVFLTFEEALRLLNGRLGEELVLIATRGDTARK